LRDEDSERNDAGERFSIISAKCGTYNQASFIFALFNEKSIHARVKGTRNAEFVYKDASYMFAT
jgi:hypothetical protein